MDIVERMRVYFDDSLSLFLVTLRVFTIPLPLSMRVSRLCRTHELSLFLFFMLYLSFIFYIAFFCLARTTRYFVGPAIVYRCDVFVIRVALSSSPSEHEWALRTSWPANELSDKTLCSSMVRHS